MARCDASHVDNLATIKENQDMTTTSSLSTGDLVTVRSGTSTFTGTVTGAYSDGKTDRVIVRRGSTIVHARRDQLV